MIKSIEKYFNVSFMKMDCNENYDFIYNKYNNLEILISVKSMYKYSNEIRLLCGEYKDNAIYYKSDLKDNIDMIIAGNVKMRLIFFSEGKVKTISKKDTDRSSIFDAEIRQKYPLLPAPKIFEIMEDNTVIEELIINKNRKNYLLSHPKDTIEALNAMKLAYCKYFEIRKCKYYSVIHGQLYKSDHILKDSTNNIYLVDWSEGGNKDLNAKSNIYFDIVSSIKWVIFYRRFKLYYYLKYIDQFIDIAYQIAKTIGIIYWKEEFLSTMGSLYEINCSFNKNNILVKNLSKRITNYND